MTAQSEATRSEQQHPLTADAPPMQAPAAQNDADTSSVQRSSAASVEDDQSHAGVESKAPAEPKPGPSSAKQQSQVGTAAKNSKRSKSDKADSKPKQERAAADGTTETAGASSEGKPNLRCLQISREPVPQMPAGILPLTIERLFPDAAARGPLVCALLAAVGAAAGHAFGVVGGAGQRLLSLRVAAICDTGSLASAIAPVLQAAYTVEAEEVKTWIATRQRELGQASVAAIRQRLHRQTVANAAILGLGELAHAETTVGAAPAPSAACPCFVLRDPIPTTAHKAFAATRKGVLMVDGTKMPTFAGWGRNFLTGMADVLNGANAGELLELPNPLVHGATQMRGVCVSVIGMLSTLDTFGLFKAKTSALCSTVFVPIEASPKVASANATKVLSALLARLRALEPEGEKGLRRLRLSADARTLFEQLKRGLMRVAKEAFSPLREVYSEGADLALQIAALLYLLDYAASDADQLPITIKKEVMQRAVAVVEQYALPAARNALGPASIDPVQRNARRILSYAQQNMAADEDVTVRELFRHLRRMGKPELHEAARLLVEDGVLLPKTSARTQAYLVHEAVFASENQLPDLAGDPRRPRD